MHSDTATLPSLSLRSFARHNDIHRYEWSDDEDDHSDDDDESYDGSSGSESQIESEHEVFEGRRSIRLFTSDIKLALGERPRFVNDAAAVDRPHDTAIATSGFDWIQVDSMPWRAVTPCVLACRRAAPPSVGARRHARASCAHRCSPPLAKLRNPLPGVQSRQ